MVNSVNLSQEKTKTWQIMSIPSTTLFFLFSESVMDILLEITLDIIRNHSWSLIKAIDIGLASFISESKARLISHVRSISGLLLLLKMNMTLHFQAIL